MNLNLTLLGITVLLASSVQAYAADAPSPSSDLRRPPPPAKYDQDMPRQKNLEERMSQDDRLRLNNNLNSQSNQAYPDQEQVENRRKQMREKMRGRLQRADQNNDGSISRGEAEHDMPGMARHFDQIDSNHDGMLSREEMRAAHERKRNMQKNRKQEQ